MKLRRTFFVFMDAHFGGISVTDVKDRQTGRQQKPRTHKFEAVNKFGIYFYSPAALTNNPTKNVKPPAGHRNNTNKIKATHANQLCTKECCRLYAYAHMVYTYRCPEVVKRGQRALEPQVRKLSR